MTSLEMISVAEALAAILRNTPVAATQSIPVVNALGRILADDVVSEIDVPPYTKSLMDGFALAADGLSDGTNLRVVEEIMAGDWPTQPIQSGTAARIMTGAPLPTGANAVVPLENVEQPNSGSVSIQLDSVANGQNVLQQGCITQKGATVLNAGRRLSAIDIGLLSEVGAASVTVQPVPRVAVLATGNELVPVGQPLGSGQIRNSNGPMLCGLVHQSGSEASDLGIGRDDFEEIKRLVETGLQQDILLLSGGVSAGDKDLVPAVLRELGVKCVFHKVRLRPGKPLWFGVFPANDRDVLVFGLPGNPVSSFACFWLFVRPALAALSGLSPQQTTQHRTMTLQCDFEHHGGRETYFPGRIAQHGAEPVVEPLPWKGSADLLTVTQADCLIRFPAGERQYAPGEAVDAILLSN